MRNEFKTFSGRSQIYGILGTWRCLQITRGFSLNSKGNRKGMLLSACGQSGRDCLLTWASSMKWLIARGRTSNPSLRNRTRYTRATAPQETTQSNANTGANYLVCTWSRLVDYRSASMVALVAVGTALYLIYNPWLTLEYYGKANELRT